MNPEQILEEKNDPKIHHFFSAIKEHQTKHFARRLKNLAIGKIVNELKKKHPGTSNQDAYIAIYLDDFWSWFDSLKGAASNAWQGVKTVYHDNKDQIHSILKQALFTAGKSALGSLGSSNGKIWSQDPYAVDDKYLRTLFSVSPLDNYHPAPRQTMIPLAKIYNRQTFNLMTNAQGTLLIVLNPWACFSAVTVPAIDNSWFPWLVANKSVGNFVYQGGAQTTGPFVGQATNVQGFFVDMSVMRFQTTLSPLNRQGAVSTTLFYQGWSSGSNLQKNGKYEGTTLKLTPTEIDNNTTITKNYSLQEYVELKPINRWIPNQDDLTTEPYPPDGAITNNKYCFQVLYFYGCAANANIGKLYIETGVSFNPAAAMIGMFPTEVRGGYPSTHNFIHQARKLGAKLQTSNGDGMKYLIKDRFPDVDFQSLQQALGSSAVILDARCIFNPESNGYCFQQCARFLGDLLPYQAWITAQNAFNTHLPVTLLLPTGEKSNLVSGHRRIMCDIAKKHCYVADVSFLGLSTYVPDCVDNILEVTDLYFGDSILYRENDEKFLLDKGRIRKYGALQYEDFWFHSFPANLSDKYLSFSDSIAGQIHVEIKQKPEYISARQIYDLVMSYENLYKKPFRVNKSILRASQVQTSLIDDSGVLVGYFNGMSLSTYQMIFRQVRVNLQTFTFPANRGQILMNEAILNSTKQILESVKNTESKPKQRKQKREIQSQLSDFIKKIYDLSTSARTFRQCMVADGLNKDLLAVRGSLCALREMGLRNRFVDSYNQLKTIHGMFQSHMPGMAQIRRQGPIAFISYLNIALIIHVQNDIPMHVLVKFAKTGRFVDARNNSKNQLKPRKKNKNQVVQEKEKIKYIQKDERIGSVAFKQSIQNLAQQQDSVFPSAYQLQNGFCWLKPLFSPQYAGRFRITQQQSNIQIFDYRYGVLYQTTGTMQTLEFVLRLYQGTKMKTFFNKRYLLAKTMFMDHWHVIEKQDRYDPQCPFTHYQKLKNNMQSFQVGSYQDCWVQLAKKSKMVKEVVKSDTTVHFKLGASGFSQITVPRKAITMWQLDNLCAILCVPFSGGFKKTGTNMWHWAENFLPGFQRPKSDQFIGSLNDTKPLTVSKAKMISKCNNGNLTKEQGEELDTEDQPPPLA